MIDNLDKKKIEIYLYYNIHKIKIYNIIKNVKRRNRRNKNQTYYQRVI